MSIDLKSVNHIARLARLQLSEQECERYQKQLSAILEHIDLLRRLDVEKVEPFTHPGEFVNVLRPDVPKEPLAKSDALRNAPERSGDFFIVPRILEE